MGRVYMRTAIVSDIHGNLTALEAVLADLRLSSPDVIFHGGDLAANGAHPAEVVDRVRDLGWLGVRGNTDEMLCSPEDLTKLATQFPKLQSILANFEEMIPWTCALLGEDKIRWLQKLPYLQRQDAVAILHASPNNLWQAPLPGASELELSIYRGLEVPFVVYGHIHRPYVRRLEGMTVANTGSVSLSYDGDPRASYLLLDGASVTIRRVEYDLEREVDALLHSGLPHAQWLCQILRAGRYHQPASFRKYADSG
jgi:putative phosphoesterase